jgi:hypothetical protein
MHPFQKYMNDSDPADLDGDGSFDAIDIVILEDEDGASNKQSVKGTRRLLPASAGFC